MSEVAAEAEWKQDSAYAGHTLAGGRSEDTSFPACLVSCRGRVAITVAISAASKPLRHIKSERIRTRKTGPTWQHCLNAFASFLRI